MKKLLVTALVLASATAFASRARLTALGGSPNLIDAQTVNSNPADMFYVGGDLVNLESGKTTTVAADGQNANAEGILIKSMGDSKFALSLGNQSKNASAWGLRQVGAAAGLTPMNQQNPIGLSYGMKAGDIAFAGTLVYSNYSNKVTPTEKESSMGVRFGVRGGNFDAKLALGLANTQEKEAVGTFKGNLGISGSAGYSFDSTYVYGTFEMAGAKAENTTTEVADYKTTTYSVGAVNTHKSDAGLFLYGIALAKNDAKESVSDKKDSSMNLPLWIGFESQAASWLTLRGSIKQTTFVNQSKTEIAAVTETAPGVNNTVVAAGAGLNFNKISVDGTLKSVVAGGQDVDGNNLLSQVGLTYMF